MRHTQLIQIALISVCLMIGQTSHAASIQGQVTGVDSGELIQIKTSDGRYRQVKLTAIHIPTHSRIWTVNAKRHLAMLLAGRIVTVEYQKLTAKGVILGLVRHGGADVALQMLKAGLARVSIGDPLNPQTLGVYQAYETRARNRGMGLWQ
ncbi:MAG: thermonuclease family protein [Candidatus Thiodiazotropha lotti]|nr:thermonuclease family protein [Candidatus Thiodiazotropha lotti]MCW4222665.1 thermonuclease family protein [Candidatus Thiodiazotropha lotti]